jgi:hypothetical protein
VAAMNKQWFTVLILSFGPVVANAQLTSVDSGLGVYDFTNNVTWVSNGNLFATQAAASGNAANFVQTIINDSGGVIHDSPNANDTPGESGTYNLSAANDFNTITGAMSWYGAQAWVNYLNKIDYARYSNWRLPTTVDDSASYNSPPSPSSSELAHLFYAELGQVSGQSITAMHNGNYSLFNNVQSNAYWSGTEDALDPKVAWSFQTFVGNQDNITKVVQYDALAVRSNAPEIDPASAASSLTLLLGSLAVLCGRRFVKLRSVAA